MYVLGGWIEWIGYAASVVIALSLLMTDIVKLRVINAIGCLIFVVYGWLVGAYPVVISNGIIFIIDIYQLFKLNKETK